MSGFPAEGGVRLLARMGAPPRMLAPGDGVLEGLGDTPGEVSYTQLNSTS